MSTTTDDALPLLHDDAGSGPTLVLLPGGLTGWASWQDHARTLAETRRVVRVQLLSVELTEAGHRLPAAYSTTTELDALDATLARLGDEPVDLVGWSYGAGLALAHALRRPESLRTLTLVEPPAYWALRETGHSSTAFSVTTALARRLGQDEVTADALEAFVLTAGLCPPGTDVRALPAWPTWLRNRQALAAMEAIVAHEETLDAVGALSVPTLLVRGTSTAEDLGAVADVLAETLPRVQLVELPGGHACHLEHGPAFLEALDAHLEGALTR